MDTATLHNWEVGNTTPNLRAMPGLLRFLGYDPTVVGTTMGERLRAARVARGRSLDELAQELQVDPTTLRNWEVGRHRPPVQYWPRIYGVIGPEPADLAMPSGEQLRLHRRRLGLTQRALGRVLGIDQRSISAWERGGSPG